MDGLTSDSLTLSTLPAQLEGGQDKPRTGWKDDTFIFSGWGETDGWMRWIDDRAMDMMDGLSMRGLCVSNHANFK